MLRPSRSVSWGAVAAVAPDDAGLVQCDEEPRDRADERGDRPDDTGSATEEGAEAAAGPGLFRIYYSAVQSGNRRRYAERAPP